MVKKGGKKPYGLTPKQMKGRFHKHRGKNMAGRIRKDKYFTSKIKSMMVMVRMAIVKGVRFDYLLVDSWFTCLELVPFISTRRIGCHLLEMAKMGNKKYLFEGKGLTAKEIADYNRKSKKQKCSKKLNCYYSEAVVGFGSVPIRLFFCKTSRKGK